MRRYVNQTWCGKKNIPGDRFGQFALFLRNRLRPCCVAMLSKYLYTTLVLLCFKYMSQTRPYNRSYIVHEGTPFHSHTLDLIWLCFIDNRLMHYFKILFESSSELGCFTIMLKNAISSWSIKVTNVTWACYCCCVILSYVTVVSIAW